MSDTIYRLLDVFDGADGGIGNRLMNMLHDERFEVVMFALIDRDQLDFSEDNISDESHIPPEFSGLFEHGDYRLGWDKNRHGDDLLVLEKVYHVTGSLTYQDYPAFFVGPLNQEVSNV